MEITYDLQKQARTFSERGLDFRDAILVFNGPTINIEDQRKDYGESRTITFGLLRGRLVVVVWTSAERGRRIISMRKANDREKRSFAQRLGAG